MSNLRWLLLGGLVLLALAGCAPGVNPSLGTPLPDGQVAGFWLGLWHGFTSPITFLVSLFDGRVSVYEVHNNGAWYNFGFVFGTSAFFGGGGRGSHRVGWRKAE
jgi:hypothetical protein